MAHSEAMPLHARPERPIESTTDDRLERRTFVTRLTNALIDTNSDRATGIVVGITGPWGSGKSSVLNLIELEIRRTSPKAVIVRFDPWLVSGREDLIGQFLLELTNSIHAKKDASAQLKKIAGSIAGYAELLAPTLDFVLPGFAGKILARVSNRIKKWSEDKQGLTTQRQLLKTQLGAADAPIVVLIDEVDRIEDSEIRTVAQLVRSVADFPGISYVLAYDTKRVVQALGAGAAEGQIEERGRSYLEKIVQLQIPLPVTFAEELVAMINAELASLQVELRLPERFKNIDRYAELAHLLATELINTPRDISRVIGTFHVLRLMLRDEVDWIDLLGYCALAVKAPRTAESLRSRPDEFSDDIPSEAATIRQVSRDKKSPETRLTELIDPSEDERGVRKLVAYLFPSLSESGKRSRDERPDAICLRRPLLTTLRLGLLQGAYSRERIEALVRKTPDEIRGELRTAWDEDRLAPLIDRLDDVYLSLDGIDHVSFWNGVGKFLRKPDCKWATSYAAMHQAVSDFTDVIERAVQRDESLRPTAAKIFHDLRSRGEAELVAYWLRGHVYMHGLFGHKATRGTKSAFLSRTEAETTANELSAVWKEMHLKNELIPCRWDLAPVYTMIDTGLWDAACRAAVDELLSSDDAFDAICLMFYGGGSTTDTETVSKICTHEQFLARVAVRQKAAGVHETVQVAMRKAAGGGWPS